LPLRGKDRAGRRLLSFTAGERAQHEWLVERCQTPASPSKSPRSTADPFDRREPSSPFTKRDPRRKRREPSVHPISLSGPRGCFEAPFVMYAPACCRLRQRAGCIDPKVLFRFCHRHYTRATKPQLIVLAGPEATPGRDRIQSTSVRMLRAALGASVRTTLRRRGLCAAAFPFSGRRVVGDTASTKHTTPLVVTLWGPRARRRARTCNHYHGVTEGPSSGAPSAKRNAYRRPEAPSIECIEPELRARLASECDL